MRPEGELLALIRRLLGRHRRPFEEAVGNEPLTDSERKVVRVTFPLLQALQTGFDAYPLPALIFLDGTLLAMNRRAMDLFDGLAVPVAVEKAARRLLGRRADPEAGSVTVSPEGKAGPVFRLLLPCDPDPSADGYERVYVVSESELAALGDRWKKVFGLTNAEVEVLRLLVDGATDAQIAADTGMAAETVRDYLDRIGLKMGLPPGSREKPRRRTTIVVRGVLARLGVDPKLYFG